MRVIRNLAALGFFIALILFFDGLALLIARSVIAFLTVVWRECHGFAPLLWAVPSSNGANYQAMKLDIAI